MGVVILANVRNAAKFAVYELTIIIVKNHHALDAIRPESDLKEKY